jgi:hypothetical protein
MTKKEFIHMLVGLGFVPSFSSGTQDNVLWRHGGVWIHTTNKYWYQTKPTDSQARPYSDTDLTDITEKLKGQIAS